MIRKMRTKFIAIAGISILALLVIVVSSLNILFMYSTYNEIDAIFSILEDNNGKIPKYSKIKDFNFNGFTFTKESPYENRYFSVVISPEGTNNIDNDSIVTTEDSHISALSDKEIKNLAIRAALTNNPNKRGNIEYNSAIYTYKIFNLENSNHIRIAFLDTTKKFTDLNLWLIYTISIAFFCFLVFMLLVSILSRKVMEPFISNSENQKQFITNASHELKTPLAIISANTEVIEMTSGKNEWTESTLEQIKRLNDLIADLMVIVRNEEQEKTDISNVDISKITQNVAESFRSVIENQGKKLTYDIDENIIVQATDKGINQLITLLVDNASKYCDDNGSINISLSKKGSISKSLGSSVVLVVSNDYKDGKNVNHKKFFERFYRADTSHNSQKSGYGIGLSIVQTLIKNFKAKINVSYKDEIISFIVTF